MLDTRNFERGAVLDILVLFRSTARASDKSLGVNSGFELGPLRLKLYVLSVLNIFRVQSLSNGVSMYSNVG